MVKAERSCRPRNEHESKMELLDHKKNNLEKSELSSVFLHCFKDLSFLNIGKIVLIFHLKANNVREGENTSNQHFPLLFFSKICFLIGINSRDCLGEESSVEKRNKTMH